MKKLLVSLFVLVCLVQCGSPESRLSLEWSEVGSLPYPVSNNAVAATEKTAFTFLGVEPAKTYKDVTARAAQYNLSSNSWEEIQELPDKIGRLASTAQTVKGDVYIFGGYTVAEDGSEKSTPEVFTLSLGSLPYRVISEMPVPVDDAVSLVYKDRYIYLISGWHDTDNVSNVQVYDTQENTWQEATPYLGSPVFGHTGGIVGNTMMIMDGVKVVPPAEEGGRRSFEMAIETIHGEIDEQDHTNIVWTKLEGHPGKPRYRAASIGVTRPREMILFVGGSDNPYNYNGIGYNGAPAEPIAEVIAYDVQKASWIDLGIQLVPTMDHRGIVHLDGEYYIIGGMLQNQEVSNRVFKFQIREN